MGAKRIAVLNQNKDVMNILCRAFISGRKGYSLNGWHQFPCFI
jgi:hypothetical protein